jgi:hypothetical protein
VGVDGASIRLCARDVRALRGGNVEDRDPGSGVSRRRFLSHSAAALWSAPMIVTMMSRAASASESGSIVCGRKIDGPGTTDCRVTTPCGSASPVGCKGSPAGAPGSPCYCI